MAKPIQVFRRRCRITEPSRSTVYFIYSITPPKFASGGVTA